MDKVEIVREAFTFGDLERSAAHLADDFQWSSEAGDAPMDKAAWFGMGALLQGSFPDISNVIEDIWEHGEDVMVTSHFSGTFINDLDMTPMGMGVIPASGAHVRFPSGTVRITFDGDKISRTHETDTGPEAGLAGFVRALGVNMG